MKLHIGVLHEDQIPNALFQEFEESISVPGLIFRRETRASGVPFAGVEWLMPTIVLAYVAKPYFDSFLKEMGKDHYDLLKKGFNKLYERFAGPRAPDVNIVATQGKSSEDQPYSLFFSVVAEAPDGVRLKLLIPRPIEQTEYEIAISKFLDLVQSTYDGDMAEGVVTIFKNAPITSGTILVTYETATGKLVPVDPLAGRRPQQ
ncbi:hypothetical protein [Microvirgula aerodenitrificans]|uniref:hypothetical protein n=1 Tax=Microvirgula aerodenitrificans TaxID=57480 RepID=UPI00048AC402|nr:hypothetical protein [Microvirgula aerodenitrificans]